MEPQHLMETDDDTNVGDFSDGIGMSLLKPQDATSERSSTSENMQIDNETATAEDVEDLENNADAPVPVASQQSTQPTTCQLAGPSNTIRQIAIAPKPVTLVANRAMNAVKKISFTNLRPKIETPRRQVVVVPTTDGRVKVVGPGSSVLAGKSIATTQLVTTSGSQVIQLKQGNMPPLTKFTIVQSPNSSGNNQKAPRYISLQQAQQMGLVSDGKIQQIVLSPVKQGVSALTPIIRPVRQATTNLKSPTKILPAPPKGTINTGKVLITPVSQNIIKPAISNAAQVVKVEGSGTAVTSSASGQKFTTQQFHQINIPGKGIQYVRLVPSGINQKTNTSQVRIAPLTVSSISQTLTTSSNVTADKKAPQVVTKPVLLDFQGNILQVGTNTSQNSSTSSSTIAVKKVITTNQKIVPFTFNVTPTVRKIQSTSAGFSFINVPSMKVNNSKNKNVEVTPTNKIHKTETIDEIAEDEEDQTIGEEKKLIMASTPTASHTTSTILNSDTKHVVMVPASYIKHIQGQNANQKTLSIAANVEIKQEVEKNTVDCSLDFGMRPRKPCNCTKSQCLKLYCDCFANGEFCNQCNCNNCYNNIENEDFRQKAIRTCLERNPNAFRPKIGKAKNYGMEGIRRHNKGCNCKRSGCLKNYCECYEGKIACSANCKCVGCRNVEDYFDKRSFRKVRGDSFLKSYVRRIDEQDLLKESMDFHNDYSSKKENINRTKKPWNYMTIDVIEAVCNCLLAQAGDAETFQGPASANTTQHILEEFGRCLQELINTAQISSPSTIPDDARGLST